uniref:Uncharacterized protein n=1 Tax=Nelumbo nucifera TaxID=4432 RepID=A0A822Y1H1_NELNU|nr:TPA_asm: hypothetical protein HUJ06_027570 [Nelumbo nucifera]
MVLLMMVILFLLKDMAIDKEEAALDSLAYSAGADLKSAIAYRYLCPLLQINYVSPLPPDSPLKTVCSYYLGLISCEKGFS